jgi:uncharacterized protein
VTRLSLLLAVSYLGTGVALLGGRALLASLPPLTPDTPTPTLERLRRWSPDPWQRREASLLLERQAEAAADPQRLADELAVHGEQHREVAAQLVAQALVQAGGEPRRRGAAGTPAQPGEPWGAALPELATAPGVLLYDIESDPDARDDFLHGILRLERDADGRWPEALLPLSGPGAGHYQPLLALYEHGEARLWQRLSRLLARYPDWPLLHYGETEAVGLLRLAERQGVGEAERARLRARLIDVHQRLRRHWLLPVNSYGLKAVAGWRGFHWSQSGVDGARCLLWWRQWRLGGRLPRRGRHQLGRIFLYNRDDCRATWMVARWLLEQEGA